MSSINERFQFATGLIRRAGDHALNYFQSIDTLHIRTKGPQDMVSDADVQTELLIRDALKAEFPEDAFLGEETGREEIGRREGIWVVDPIDGTQPFINGMSCWCVSIAFVLNGVLEFGFVYSPARNELFAGGRNAAATLNDQPIRVTKSPDLATGMVGVGYTLRVPFSDFVPVFSRLLERGGMFYREGSGALTLCYVACGRLIGYVELHINSWDCLGALAVVQAAGGKYNDFLADGGLWKGNWLVAGAPEVYPALRDLLS
jgi:myo-inositol-1(or 4)-monophosphatase